ncbi:hypothetical protein [Aureimonas leprariae]|uniref:Uncharacterized protein n=1 Tax=Plantimonas leprariae TaxID=2615207 RepID=A0A7V7TV07_9HYPH|nr:hypothetical protein [Aureimonas leprariae]KAB0677008.1 hypothetical protein F6X38_19270 [Aureimonas leprariae]
MLPNDAGRARAEAVFRPDDGRHEKGSAMTLIAEQARATEDKTARLRALRMEREAAVVPEAPKPARKTVKRAARR